MKKKTALFLTAVMLLTALLGLSVTAHADPMPLPDGVKVETVSGVDAVNGDDYTVMEQQGGSTYIIMLQKNDLIVSGTADKETVLSFKNTVSSVTIKDLDTHGGAIKLSMAADDFKLRVLGESKVGMLDINHKLTMKGSGTLVCRGTMPTIAKSESAPEIIGAVVKGSKVKDALIENMTEVEWFDASAFINGYLLIPAKEYPEEAGDWCRSVVYAVLMSEESASTTVPKTGDTTVLWNLTITALLGLAGFGMTFLRRKKNTEN